MWQQCVYMVLPQFLLFMSGFELWCTGVVSIHAFQAGGEAAACGCTSPSIVQFATGNVTRASSRASSRAGVVSVYIWRGYSSEDASCSRAWSISGEMPRGASGQGLYIIAPCQWPTDDLQSGVEHG